MNLLQQLKYSPIFAHLVITRRCNLSCAYCNEYDKASKPVPLNVLKNRIQKYKELGGRTIALFGGEPLLHPQIGEIIRFCKSKKIRVGLITNGFLLTEQKITELNDSGLEGLQISIDGVKPNDTTIKVLDNLQKKLELLYTSAQFKVVINTVIGAAEPEESQAVIEAANKFGFYSSVGILHDDAGQIHLTSDQRSIYYKLIKIRKRMFWELDHFQDKLIENGEAPFKCRSGSRYLYIDEFGYVHWCSQMKKVFKKKIMDYTYEDLKEQFFKPKVCNKRCTLSCGRVNSMLDSWRKQ